MGKIMLNEIGYSGGNANVIRLTQAEYDALPPSKLTDNNVYMITDANGDGSQFQPVIYSEDEREIGVWTDGKPLYQKTFSYIGQYGGNGTLQTNLSNIDNIFIFNAYCEDTDNAFLPLPYSYYSSQYAMGIFITNSFDIAYRTFNSSQEIINPIITLQYTKTTDTAGSGTWTPQGVPAIHYSTDEQVIGTWINGSTLYEKTFVTTLPNSPDIGSDSMLIGTLTDFNDIIKIEGTIKDVTANAWCATSGLPWYNGVNGWQYSFHINPSGQLCIWFASNNIQYYNAYKGGKAIATVQYTKSSQGGN